MTGTSLKHQVLLVRTHSNGRAGHKVTKIVVHHMAGNLSLAQLQRTFTNRKSSATYGIDARGNIAQYVDEADRPWTTSGSDPDNYCITLELANDATGGDWHISDATMHAAVSLCADICKRYGIPKLYYDGKRGTLLRHCDYSATACPGAYFKAHTAEFCNAVNKLLTDTENAPSVRYKVQTGAFKSKENAERYAEQLNKQGIATVIKEE